MAIDVDLPHAVIRFKRDVRFPRFSMKQGERWGFVVFGKMEQRLRAIKAGERFEFAGGQCLAEDVEIIYEGPCGMEYSVAAGYVRDESTEQAEVATFATKLEAHVARAGAQLNVKGKTFTFAGASTDEDLSVATLKGPRTTYSAVRCVNLKVAGRPDAEAWVVLGSSGKTVCEFAVCSEGIVAIR